MATVEVQFKPSKIKSEQGVIFYQVTHNHVAHQYATGLHVYADEWDSRLSEVILPRTEDARWIYLSDARKRIRIDMDRFYAIISAFEYSGFRYTAADVVAKFSASSQEEYLFPFMEEVIASQKLLGKVRTSETYASSLSSFRRFRKGKDLTIEEIDSDMMAAYETYLKSIGISPNTSSFYMRNLRAVYNRAVEKGLSIQRYPFRHVYTGVGKTVKRAVPLNIIRQIIEMELSENPLADFARDMFLFSFYTRGMSFVDMAYLRKKDLNGSVLSYHRRKTGQQLFIKWEKCMQEIVDKYDTSQSKYLLPIIKPCCNIEERKQYIHASHNINRYLKVIGCRLGLSVSLTMYVSRHAWASIAKNMNVPVSVISEGLGHDSEITTRIYLASLDTIAIDNANNMILKSLRK